ncbi:MAG: fused MFS/spermidine synthase, partial [bacterium]|nr:fused MFS/spermidine synthase [bacterium]
MKKHLIYLVVSISGASVLALEILGTRILGPFYGVSIFLWSALITITLAALSTGYFIGGWWADKGAKIERLSVLLAGAGVWVILIPFITRPILSLIEPMGLRLSVLVASVILFFPPLTLLGMISPYAIKIKTTHLSEVGRSAGNLYAISTLASVISALSTGFFLIPNFGVKRLTLFVGFILILTAIFIWLFIKKAKLTAAITSMLLLTLTFFSWQLISEQASPQDGLLFVKHSPYGEIRVVEKDEVRYLLIDGAIHSMANTTLFGGTRYSYVVVMDINKHFFRRTGEMLIIGLGGGSIANNYSMDGWKVDAVEIDSVVTYAAMEYFGFRRNDCQVFHQDGRQFLITHEKQYDLIVMDAFGSSSIPFHLITKESFGLIADRLKPGGVFAINLQSIGWNSTIVRSVAATVRQHFDQVIALPIHEPPNT